MENAVMSFVGTIGLAWLGFVLIVGLLILASTRSRVTRRR